MSAPAPTEAAAPLDLKNMSKVQKLAALLVILGPDNAAPILKGLDESVLEAVSTEMARLTLVPQPVQREILEEFSAVAVEASAAVLGGVGYAQTALEKSVGLFRATSILGRVAAARPSVAAIHEIAEMDARSIYNLLKDEQPQTVALLLSYLAPDKGAQLLVLFNEETRGQIVERLASLAPTPIKVVEQVVRVLLQRVGPRPPGALNQTGGLKTAADLLKALDKNLSKSLLVSLEERNAELGQGIRQKMFTFEDLVGLDTSSLQKILREIDMRDLAVSLKNASDKLKAKLLGCISKRAAETVNEEIGFMGPLKAKDIDASQQRIIEVVRRLESEGEIELESATKNEA